jgi:hypothetical protein
MTNYIKKKLNYNIDLEKCNIVKTPLDYPKKALIIKEPFLSYIFEKRKSWEIRGNDTKIRGRIGLIGSGTGMILGECEINGSYGPLEYIELINLKYITEEEKNNLKQDRKLPYINKDNQSKTYGWEFKNVKKYLEPIPYNHPKGAIIFVNIKT